MSFDNDNIEVGDLILESDVLGILYVIEVNKVFVRQKKLQKFFDGIICYSPIRKRIETYINNFAPWTVIYKRKRI